MKYKCKGCDEKVDATEVSRVYGTLLVLQKYCTPQCYTKAMMATKETKDVCSDNDTM